MDHAKLVRDIVEKLHKLSEPTRVGKMGKSNPTKLIIKGVTVPNLRPIINELTKKFKQYPPDEVIAFVKLLNAERILEAQQIAFELIEKHKFAQKRLTLEDLLILGKGMDNWISVDYFACLLAGPAWRNEQISDRVLEEWAISENRWWRRAAVVSTVALNQKARGGSGDVLRTLKICSLVVADNDEMVSRALSWALRELAKRDAEPVIGFIFRNEHRLKKHVVQEVRRKITTGKKH